MALRRSRHLRLAWLLLAILGAMHAHIGLVLFEMGALAAAPTSALEVPSAELPAKLDLDRALSLFRTHGLDLLIADAAVASAEGELTSAGAVPNPSLSVGYGRSVFYGACTDAAGQPSTCPPIPGLWTVSASDQAALSDGISGKRGLRRDVARAALRAAKGGRADAQRVLESQVRQQFVQALVAGEALRVARDVARVSKMMFELTETRFRVGSVSEADLARMDTARLESDQAVDAALGNLQAARFALAFLLGVRGRVPDFEVQGPQFLRGAAFPNLEGAGREALLGRAFQARPDLGAARDQVARAEASLRLARRERFPDIALSLSYSQQGTGTNSVTPPTYSLGLSAPLPVFYRQQGEIQSAEADLRAQRLQLARLESSIVNDVETAWSGYVASARQVRRMEGGLLASAHRARELVLVQYQKGAASLLDYLDAQRTYAATSAEYLQDLTSFWTAVFRLEQAVGVELR